MQETRGQLISPLDCNPFSVTATLFFELIYHSYLHITPSPPPPCTPQVHSVAL
jgi:hypothetical protein